MSEPKPEPCYREATNGVHFTRNTHRHDCAEVDCRGCKPCPGRHCTARTNCTWHVDAAVCDEPTLRPIGKSAPTVTYLEARRTRRTPEEPA